MGSWRAGHAKRPRAPEQGQALCLRAISPQSRAGHGQGALALVLKEAEVPGWNQMTMAEELGRQGPDGPGGQGAWAVGTQIWGSNPPS